MAAKKQGGNGNVVDLRTRVLVEIRDEIRGDLKTTNARLDNLRDLSGDKYRELDARLKLLEARVPH